MLKKLFVLIIMLLITTSSFVIVSNRFEVKATPGGGGEGEWENETLLDYKYIWKAIKDFADVVRKQYDEGEIRKGRDFGTPGDNWTADYIKTELDKMDLKNKNVEKIPIQNISSKKFWHYNYKVDVIDYDLNINGNNPPIIQKNETYALPTGTRNLIPGTPNLGKMNYNNSFTNLKVVPKNLKEKGSLILNADYSNISYDNITEYDVTIGNATYIPINSNISEDQELRVFLLDEEEDVEYQLENITSNASAVILLNDNKGYEADTTKCNVSVIARAYKSDSNITKIIELLENGTTIIADNFESNESFTFSYNHSYTNWSWCENDFFYVTPHGEYQYKISDLFLYWIIVRNIIMYLINGPVCHGVIAYDIYDNTHLMWPPIRKWIGWADTPIEQMLWYIYRYPCLQMFLVNRSVGQWLENHYDEPGTSVSGFFEQAETWVEAYNVMVDIGIDHSPNDNITVISNRYDGWWSEAPGDSGVGTGIVLGIAKYFTDYNITPKCNLTFLFTTGEEWGFRGAWHYSHSHPEKDYNITRWIGTDQLGFNQSGSYLNPLLSDNDTTGAIVEAIAEDTMYENRTGYGFLREEAEPRGTDDYAIRAREEYCDTICIHKNAKPHWSGHHRTGMNYTEGDSINYIDRNDTNVTFEYAWNIVKYFTVNPDCWFNDTGWNYNISDSEDNCSYDDTVYAEFDVKSTLPHDKVMINISLVTHGEEPVETVKYKVINSTVNRTWKTMNVSFILPADESAGYYKLKFQMYNSTGCIDEIIKPGDSKNINVTKLSDEPFFLNPYDYCGNAPNITNVSATPNTVGFGFNVTISADVVSTVGSDIDVVEVIITDPDFSTNNFTMANTVNDTYEYVFNNTWRWGKYGYVIWGMDENGNKSGTPQQHYFYVKAKATVSVCTIKDSYGSGEIVNLTDPPGDNGDFSQEIGYEFLDEGKVLRIWNRFDSYYFNTSNGIQFTNHKDDYWSHNILMLGYYNNDVWNLIYRTDELSGFNKNITSDNETFVNATLWKDLTYQGYDFRLAIRYYLGVDDNELTVIPYIKNLDEDDIPYVLGFGWEIKDIQVDMTPEFDYIEINGTWYYLNQSLDETYKNMDSPCYFIKEDISDTRSKSLYLRWDNNLNYRVGVKSRDGQYNAPVSLFIRIGTLDAGQEKYTELYWYDADQITYFFNGYNVNETWPVNPENMVDGDENTYASTGTVGIVELCNNNTCNGSYLGCISKAELRVKGYRTGFPSDIILRPVYNGITDGNNYTFNAPSGAGNWSEWFDIPPKTAKGWNWSEIKNLDCDVESDCVFGDMFTLYCSKVELRVTYTTNFAPVITNPYPEDGSIGIGIAPMLNITVSDLDGDPMIITWFSNSSGSWQIFETNESVNGTYHQVFSNASVNGRWWYWNVNVTDGKTESRSDIFSFYTGFESKIHNTGNTNFSGYLLMRIDYYNEISEEWEVDMIVIDEESTPRVINSSEKLPLDTIFNPENVNTSSFHHGDGTYRVYAALRDPWNNVLHVCNDFQTPLTGWWYLEDWYEFTVTYD